MLVALHICFSIDLYFQLPTEHLYLDNLLLIQTQDSLFHHLAFGTTAIKENSIYNCSEKMKFICLLYK